METEESTESKGCLLLLSFGRACIHSLSDTNRIRAAESDTKDGAEPASVSSSIMDRHHAPCGDQEAYC